MTNDAFDLVPACFICGNYTQNNTCKAFPKGIPENILSGQDSHTAPYIGDRGIQFEENMS